MALSFRPIALLALVLAAMPTNSVAQFSLDFIMGMIPSSILDKIPMVCRESNSAEFQTAIGCGVSKLLECPGLVTQMSTLGSIPSIEDVTTCEEIEEPFCKIASTCTPCEADFDALLRCMVGYSGSDSRYLLMMEGNYTMEDGNYTMGGNLTMDEEEIEDTSSFLDACPLSCSE